MLFRTFEQRYGVAGARQRARRVVAISWGVLLAVTLATGLMLAQRGGTESLLPVLVRIVPLALLGIVLRTERRRGYGWLAFVSVLYLIQGAAMLQLPGLWWLGLVEALSALALLLTAGSYAYHIRHWQRGDHPPGSE
ncbi:hypothetical protein GCM10010082_09850 [Kushneria pakistanensis]|uniref:DUF2069 domain-containing protein n=1 Tax=Kushneria pakistanensis TaxID=1508770 RepID=A0ABQ3FDT5_9GAMM|nr:DUF2069 domain-containing protein [Kushneria pakistanensis]GHC20071.1 hypothetical protein GCM10010082_09850 [Kushneria pakistanensis]